MLPAQGVLGFVLSVLRAPAVFHCVTACQPVNRQMLDLSEMDCFEKRSLCIQETRKHLRSDSGRPCETVYYRMFALWPPYITVCLHFGHRILPYVCTLATVYYRMFAL